MIFPGRILKRSLKLRKWRGCLVPSVWTLAALDLKWRYPRIDSTCFRNSSKIPRECPFGGFHSHGGIMGVPQNGCFIWKNATKIRMMTGGTPIYGNHHLIWLYSYNMLQLSHFPANTFRRWSSWRVCVSQEIQEMTIFMGKYPLSNMWGWPKIDFMGMMMTTMDVLVFRCWDNHM